MTKIIASKIAIQRIKLYKTNLNLSEEFLNNPYKPASYEVAFGHQSAVDFEKKSIRFRLETILDGVNSKKERMGLHAEYGIEFHFTVENFEKFIVVKEGNKKVDSNLGVTLLSIVFSTSRGIILDRTQGTYLDGLILPVIDPKELFDKLNKDNQL